jgi:hypothetical protein
MELSPNISKVSAEFENTSLTHCTLMSLRRPGEISVGVLVELPFFVLEIRTLIFVFSNLLAVIERSPTRVFNVLDRTKALALNAKACKALVHSYASRGLAINLGKCISISQSDNMVPSKVAVHLICSLTIMKQPAVINAAPVPFAQNRATGIHDGISEAIKSL